MMVPSRQCSILVAVLALGFAGCATTSDTATGDLAKSCEASWVTADANPFRHELRQSDPGGYLKSPATDALIDQVADPLRRAYGFKPGQPPIYVIPEAAAEARAMPENDIFISYGMLKQAGSSDVVAGVLAHEMGHVACHHAAHNAMWDVADWALHAGFIAVAVGGASWTSEMTKNAQAFVVLGGLGGTAQTELSEWAYAHAGWSRGQETKADLIGTEMLIRAHKRTTGLVVALSHDPENLAQVQLGRADSSAFSGPNHPAESTRVDAISDFLAKVYPDWHDPPLDNAPYQAWEAATRRMSLGLAHMLSAQNAVGKPLALFGHKEAVSDPRRAQIALREIRLAFSIPRWNPATELPPPQDPELAALAELTLTHWVVDEVRLRLAPQSLDQAEARKRLLARADVPQNLMLLDDAALVRDGHWNEATAEALEIEIRAGDQRILYPLEIAANSGGTDKPLNPVISNYVSAKCLLTADLDVMQQCTNVEKNPMPTISSWWQTASQEPAMIVMPALPPPRKTRHRGTSHQAS